MIGWRIRRRYNGSYTDMCRSARPEISGKYSWREATDWRYDPILFKTEKLAKRMCDRLMRADKEHFYVIEKVERILIPSLPRKSVSPFP